MLAGTLKVSFQLIPKQKETPWVSGAFTLWYRDRLIERNHFFLDTKFEKEFIMIIYGAGCWWRGKSSFF